MSYQVLARRWRPKTFAELVGQAPVVRALSNALDNDRLHHAYLFTGTRGVGKTTIARILAKSLNCETGVTSQPCGQCSVCREVDEGRYVDLIEVDAASKTGVDDTRELLENVPYAPVRGRYKVYLVDEVHMFSTHSFNALLKTLEEPPPHVKFLLATTDPQRVPVTVLSRCLQFSLQRLPLELIQQQFEHILGAEGIKADTEALYHLARAADGSMRDGLSLLDQAIAYGGGELKRAEVRDMLGVSSAERMPQLLEWAHLGDASQLLEGIRELAQQAPDFSALLKEVLLLLHRIGIVQAAPQAWQAEWGERGPVDRLAELLGPEDTQLYYQIALLGQRDLPLAPDPQSGFEMVLLRLHAFRPDEAGDAVGQSPPGRPVSASKTSPRADAGKPERDTAQSIVAPSSAQSVPPPSAAAERELGDWHALLPQLRLGGMAAQLANHCVVKAKDARSLTLAVAPDARTLAESGSMAREKLQQALDRYLGYAVKLQFEASEALDTPAQRQAEVQADRQQDAEQAVANDPLVKALQETFDAEVVPGSVRPTEG